MSNFFTTSELASSNAYLSAEVTPPPQLDTFCTNEARKKMGLDKGHPDFAQGETGRKQAANFAAKLKAAYDECIKRKSAELPAPDYFEIGDFNLENLLKPPYVYIIGGIGVLVVGVLIGRAIR